MSKLQYSCLNDDWKVEDGTTFVAPINNSQPGQTVMFSDRVRNGSISADITLLNGIEYPGSKEKRMEACLIFRYISPEGSYYAGTGAFKSRFFIGKVLPGPIWLERAYVGQLDSLRLNKTYRLKVEFSGSRIVV